MTSAFSSLRAAALVTVAAATLACARAESTPVTKTAAAAAPASGAAPAGDSTARRADLGRVSGDSAAKLWLVMVSDFQCPYCKQWHDEDFAAVRREYVETGKVKMAFVNFPLPNHANAYPASEAAMCAAAQDKFWAMHDALFTSQQRWAEAPKPAAVLDSLAGAAGVNLPALHACMTSGAVRPLIDNDKLRAQAAGVRATPSFMIGDTMVEGAVDLPTMRKAIDAAIAKAATAPAAK